ncbi:MAG: hypothetical protein V1774_11980 [Candidatus Eisenbacteria bacterium]
MSDQGRLPCARRAALRGRVPWALAMLAWATGSLWAAEPTLPPAAPAGELSDWMLRHDASTGALRLGVRGAARAATAFPPASLSLAGDRAADFIAGRAKAFGVPASDLRPGAARRVGKLILLDYAQFHGDLPVEGARLTLACDPRGEALLFHSTLAETIDLPQAEPQLSNSQAREQARRALPEASLGADFEWIQEQLVVLPRGALSPQAFDTGGSEPSSPVQPPTDRRVWRLLCRTRHPAGVWRMLVDAVSGEVLEMRSLVFSMAPPDGGAPDSRGGEDPPAAGVRDPRPSAVEARRTDGVVLGRVHQPDPWSAERTRPFPHLKVAALEETTLVAGGFTDSLGRFDFPGAEGASSLLAALEGRFCAIHRGNLAVPPTSWTGTPRDTILWEAGNSADAEREAYLAVNHVHDRLRSVAGGAGLPAPFTLLDQPVPVVVDDEELDCNAYAYADPESPWLRFSPANEPCPSLGRVSAVVYHEYAHLITFLAYWPDLAVPELSEGFADFHSVSLADTPLVALGWQGPGTWLRDLEQELSRPLDPVCALDPHCAGVLIAGALWDMRAGLIDEIPDRDAAVHLAETLFHFMRLGRPTSSEACLWHLLLQDDDDANLSNGTPHLESIAAGFEQRRIADFTPHLAHEPMRDQIDAGSPDTLRMNAWSLYPLAEARLHFRVSGGAFSACAMERVPARSATETPVYRAILPAAAAGARIEYYLTASDSHGHTAALPADAPSAVFSFRVGPDDTAPVIQHRSPLLASENPGSLRIVAKIEDNRDTLAFAFVDASLVRDAASEWLRSFALSPKASGSPWHEALIEAGELQPGDRILYGLRAGDVSPGNNTARNPEAGAHALDVVPGYAWDFETPSDLVLQGWEVVPVEAQDAAFPAPSGDHVVRAAHSGREARSPALMIGDSASLVCPFLDLRDWTHARFDFSSRAEDGTLPEAADVQARGAAAGPWITLAPLAPLPVFPDLTEDGPASWMRLSVPLDAFAGDSAQVRILWAPGPAAAESSWMVDDLCILAAPALPPPSELSASSGEDGQVTLDWQPPDQDLARGRHILGYAIYRARLPGGGGPRIAFPPSYVMSYTDVTSENGLDYYYSVSALYEEGESPRTPEVRGAPFRSLLELPYPALEGVFTDGGTGADTLLVSNAGTGSLSLEFVLADPSESWKETAIRLPLRGGSPAGFRRIADDPPDSPETDLSYLAFREVSGRLVLRIGLHRPLPDPETSFTLFMLFDTDLSLATGLAGRAVGGDLLLAMGRGVFEQTQHRSISALLDERYEFLGTPSGLILQEGADSIEVGIPLSFLGTADSIACEIKVQLEAPGGTRFALAQPEPMRILFEQEAAGDRFPDAPASSSWLALSTRSATARPGSPFPLELTYDFAGRPELAGRAKLFIRSNDADRPLTALPILVRRAPGDWITRLVLERPAPNPFSTSTDIRLRVPAGTAWRVDVVDASGRLVRRLAAGRSSAAEILPLPWDGRRNDGSAAESGCYFVVARAGREENHRRVLLIR